MASWQQDLSSLLRFYDYPNPKRKRALRAQRSCPCPLVELWTYLRARSSNEAAFARLCTNLLERFQREIRRDTKVRDHQFPKPESVLKLIYSESERYDPKSPFVARWERRRLRGFIDVQPGLEEMFIRRYSRGTQLPTQNS